MNSASTSRQILFSGTEVPPPHLAIDHSALKQYLNGRIDGSGAIEIRKFKGGQSNPTYRVEFGDRTYVLRRRPPGRLMPSAHAIDREYRVINALSAATIPVPKPYLYCSDESVIGSSFYIVEFIDGRVFWDAELPLLTVTERSTLYAHMNDVLARLHEVDFSDIGLGDFGLSDGFVARNLRRWSKVYRESNLVPIPDMDWLMRVLDECLPASGKPALLHGDYGLFNLIIHPTEPRILAVLDWEMATLGDPFVDLFHHLRPWWDTADSKGSATSLLGLDLPELGIPDMDRYISEYLTRRGIGVIPNSKFYLAFAQFRYAAMVQGILKRAADGTSSSRAMLHTQERVVEIAAMARRTLE